MKKLFSIILILITLVSFSHTVLAVDIAPQTLGQTSTVYRLLAPIGIKGNCIDTSGMDQTCAKGGIGDYFNIIFQLAIGICGVLAVIMIIVGGVQYMGDESIFGKTEAKSKIVSAILGLLIAIGSYALLNTINPDLIGKGGLSVSQVTAEISPDTAQSPAKDGSYPGTTYKYGDAWPSDKTNRDSIAKISGVTISGGPCSKVGDGGCSSVYQLDESYVKKLRGKCSACDLTITEGTAFWKHAANTKKVHYPGGWTVDLRKTSSLTSYFHGLTKTHFDKWFQGSGADCYTGGDGLSVVEEGDHFHALSLTGGCDLSKQGV